MDNQHKKPVVLPTDVPIDFAFEKMFKDFIHKVKKEGIIEEIRRRRYYQKPSEKKRLARKGQKYAR